MMHPLRTMENCGSQQREPATVHCCVERSRTVRAADPIHLRRASRPPEQGKWGRGRSASPWRRLENNLAMAQRNSAVEVNYRDGSPNRTW